MSGSNFGRKFNIDSVVTLSQADVDAAHTTVTRYAAHDLDAMLGFAAYEGGNTRSRTNGATKRVARRPQFTPSGDAA